MAGGRPPFEPTDQQRSQVTLLAAVGTRHVVIAKHIGCDLKTLKKYFKPELKEGRTDINALIAKSLAASALKGSLIAQIFWLKTRANWRETSVNEITGPNGERLIPQPINLGISFIDGGPGMPRPDPGGGGNDREGIFVTPPANLAEGVEVDAELAVDVLRQESPALEAPRESTKPRRMTKGLSAAAQWAALGGEESDT